MISEQWNVACRDVVGRERTLRVVVRGSEVVIVAPPGEIAVLDHAAAARLRSAVVQATQVVSTPALGAPGAAATGTASTAEQYTGGRPPAAEGRPALPSYRGGTTTPIPGPAATPAVGGVHG